VKYLRNIFFTVFVLILCSLYTTPLKATDPLPSWNEGAAKQTIVNFIRTTTDEANADYIPTEERIATFDQDGTLWVEQPIYTQLIYCLDRIPLIVEAKPELKDVEPFKTVVMLIFLSISKMAI
jgi:hypothetical protein